MVVAGYFRLFLLICVHVRVSLSSDTMYSVCVYSQQNCSDPIEPTVCVFAFVYWREGKSDLFSVVYVITIIPESGIWNLNY